MPFEIVRDDIVNMQVDAIVNTANPSPVIGFGVDRAIHSKAGPGLLMERKAIGYIPVGEAAATSACELEADIVIHAVCPVWQGGDKGEAEQLERLCERILLLALENGCQSIAFPMLSSGNHGFPKPLVLQIMVGVFSRFLMEYEMDILLAVFSQESLAVSERLMGEVRSYIDENYYTEKSIEEYGVADKSEVRELELEQIHRAVYRQKRASAAVPDCNNAPTGKDGMIGAVPESLREENPDDLPCDELCDDAEPEWYGAAGKYGSPSAVSGAVYEAAVPDRVDFTGFGEGLVVEPDEGFSETLMRMIDSRGLRDPEVYKKANIDRKLFSKIRSNPDYRPGKMTALALAIALELDLEQTRDLIGRAGYALTHSSKSDIIIEYFIIHKNYNIFELNEVLFAFDQPLMGA